MYFLTESIGWCYKLKNVFSYYNCNYNILPKIRSPKDLKNLSHSELKELCAEIRSCIILTVSKNGGHLASNLGVVELTVTLHKEFNSPDDKIIWDVSHQSYAHKLLTGRYGMFHTLRKEDGLSGFTNPLESEHDIFVAGHASTSLSLACGIAKAELLKNSKNNVIAVIGDGALTGGMAYEALNNAAGLKNLLIILNCNDMSISKTVGTVSKYISNLRINKTYISFNALLGRHLKKIPFIGNMVKKTLNSSKEAIKKMVYESNFFSDLGYSFLNFVDGHNILELKKAFNWAKQAEKPAIIRVFTKKGKGYIKSEKNPELYHGVEPFNIHKGLIKQEGSLTFSIVFGKYMCELAKNDENICVITAAMGEATGLFEFKNNFEDRYFDVGIAEEHAVTFAAGLSRSGIVPVFAIYSTFLQRSYDQLIHDVAIQGAHVVLAIDRAGIVGQDGKTHQGIFDVSFLTSIPNIKIYAPATYSELRHMLKTAIYKNEGLVAVRYPKGEELKNITNNNETYECTEYSQYGEYKTTIAITYGILFGQLKIAKKELLENNKFNITILRIKKIYPISENIINELKKYNEIFFFEEGIKSGGIGEHLILKLIEHGYTGKYTLKAIDNAFVEQSSIQRAWEKLGLSSSGIKSTILNKTIYRRYKNNDITKTNEQIKF